MRAALSLLLDDDEDGPEQNIAFYAPAPQTYSPNGTFALSASATSGLTVTFSSTTPAVCSVSGSTATILSAGSCIIAADQSGNTMFNAAPTVTQTVAIGQAAQTITFGSAPSIRVGTFGLLSATGGASGQPVTFSSQTLSICAVSGAQVQGLAVGTCIVAANQAASTNYSAAPQVTQTFTVTQGTQTISFNGAPTVTVGHSAALSATGGASGNPVVFSSTTPSTCNVSGTNGSTVNGVAGGTCTIAANQAGNANYQAAPQVMQSFPILQQPTITSISPTSGPPNTTVTINGTNFSANAAGDVVSFNGLQATVLTANATVLTVSVPAYATTGQLVVSVAGLYANGGTFTITPAPVVTGFSPFGGSPPDPTTGTPGDTVTITGNNFASTTSGNVVRFNGVNASVTSASTTSLTAVVPASATTGPITVTVGGQTGTSANNFFVLTSSGFPSTQVCSGKAPPIDPGSNPGHPGLWQNPKRSGTAWSFHFNSPSLGGFAAAWFTYDAGGRPVWLSNQNTNLVPAQSPNEYYSPLYKTTVNPATGAKTITPVGQLYVAFVPGSNTNAAIRWQWDDVGAAMHDECVYDYFHSTTTTQGSATVAPYAGTATLDESYTGLWSPSSGTSGWGIATTVGTCPSNGILVCANYPGSAFEYDMSMIYDTAGKPVWIPAVFLSPTTAATTANVDYSMSTYPGGFPTSTCTNSANCIKHYNVTGSTSCTGNCNQFYNNTGTFTRSFSDNFHESVTLNVSVSSSITGSDAISWPMGPWTSPTTMSKSLTEDPLVSVSQSYCDTTCTIQVSWATGTSTAQLFKRDLTTNTLTVFQANSTGSMPDTLSYGADVQYELRNGSTGTAPLLFKSAEVRVGTPSTPTPAVYSFAPPSGPVGTVVTINGANFDPITLANNVVKFNNSSPAIVQQPTTTTTLTVVVPNDATTGAISVTVGSLTGTSTSPYTVTAANVPSIDNFAPDKGSVGTQVTINGKNFSPTVSGNVVTFSGTSTPAGIVGTPTTTRIVATVPTGAQTGTFTVKVGTVTVTSPGIFQIQTGTPLTLPPVALSVAADLPVHDATVGTMQGQASTDGGAAQYHIPIVVPPGRAGMQPNLALAYNSRSGNGVMGVGWSISGLSSIHRCPQTPEQDGQTKGVSYTNNDRLCLDGQRLVLVNGGTYGASGAEYRTEVDSYARITQIGGDLTSTGAGTTCFRVEQKDGRVLHYGAVTGSITNGALSTGACTVSSTANSRVTPGGAPAVLSWLVEKIEDRTGNNMLFAYTGGANGEDLIKSITYTGVGNSSGDRLVTFTYQARNAAVSGSQDISSSYLAGGLTRQTQALQSVATSVGGSTARTYTPSYIASSYSGRLMMVSLQECAADTSGNKCHPATQFVYNDSAPSSTPAFKPSYITSSAIASTISQGTGTGPGDILSIPDLSGNGVRKTMVSVNESDGNHTFLVEMGADNQVHGSYDLTSTLAATGKGSLPLDLNSYADIAGMGQSAMILLPNSSSDPQQVVSFLAWDCPRAAVIGDDNCNPANHAPFITVKSDIPYLANNAPLAPVSYETLSSTTVTIGGHPYYEGTIHFHPSMRVRAMDFDGDGRTDVVFPAQATECGSNVMVVDEWDQTQQKMVGVSYTFVHTGIFVYLNATSGSLAAATTAHFQPIQGAKSDGSTYQTPGLLACLTFNPHDTGNSANNSLVTLETEVLDHIADFDGDGLPDFFITDVNLSGLYTNFSRVISPVRNTNGTFSVVSKSCAQIGLNNSGSTGDECHWSVNATNGGSWANFATWTDVNGDGLDDFVIARPGGTWQIHLNQGNGTLGSLIDTGSNAGLDVSQAGGSFLRYAGKLPVMDVDGDGKPDMLIVSSAQKFALKVCTAIPISVQSNGEGCPTATVNVALPGLIATQPAQLLSGDSVLATNACVAYSCPEDPGSTTLNMPCNWDGARCNGTGTGQVGWPYAYPAEGGSSFAAGDGGIPVTQGAYSPKGDGGDKSVYHLAQLKFVQDGNGGISAQVVETPLISNLSGWVNKAEDAFGNGLSSLVTTLGCHGVIAQQINSTVAPHYYNLCRIVSDTVYGKSTLPDGTPADGPTTLQNGTPISGFSSQPVVTVNVNVGVPAAAGSTAKAVANTTLGSTSTCTEGPQVPGASTLVTTLPGLMASATNGLGDQAFWSYDSLSLGMLCKRDGVSEYAIQNPVTGNDAGYVDARHYYFGSSMPVVSAMAQSNGVGGFTGARSAAYSYSEAMYNHLGRGFQGFRTITTESLFSDTSKRRLITQTLFNQKFPLAGKIDTVTTTTPPAQQSRTIHVEHDTYVCVNSDGTTANCPAVASASTVYRPVLGTQTTNESDLGTGGAVSHATTSNGGWDIYGNLGTQTITQGDDATGGVFVSSHVTTTTNTYDPADIPNWYVNRLRESTVTATVAYDSSNHSAPANTQISAQQLDTRFSWNGDRTPASKTVQFGVANQESTTTYSYPFSSYGLPSQVSVSGPSVSPSRTTSYTYSKDGSSAAADGYFVLTTKNGLNQTTTTTVQPRDGQVVTATDPNNVVVATTYDAFGRATHVTHKDPSGNNIEAPIDMAVTSCKPSCSGVGEDSNESSAVLRATTVQQGSPTQVVWMDVLGRKVKQATAGFKNISGGQLNYHFIGAFTTYDEAGTVAYQSTPYITGTTAPFLAGYTYDALNRLTEKDTPNTCSYSDLMKTTYQYVGRQTNIKVQSSCTGGTASGPIYMSRSTNVLGQLMQTIDANGNDTTYTVGKPTNYWTEPLGHVAAIKDVEGNITLANYNALGHRLKSIDPDQGTWNFTYNALGELATQTDARGVIKTISSRDALGRVTEQKQVPPASGTNIPTDAIVDDWTWDATADGVAQIGRLGKVVRKRGSNLTTPTSNAQVWEEDYLYEPGARLAKTTTTINEASTSPTLITQLSYDQQGHIDTQTYPSGLAVKHSYTAYGQLDALSSGSTVYWEAQAANEWGHVTTEQFPGVITGSHSDYDQTGQSYRMAWSGGAVNDQLAYTYDGFGNLVQQSRSGQTGYIETYNYDSLQRLQQATRNATPVTYQYSDSGNLTLKNDNGATSYRYDKTNSCGPHAVTTANGQTYTCDANGNVVGGTTLTVTYDAENFARTGSRGGQGSMTWAHDAKGQMAYSQSTSRGNRYYGPGGYEQLGAVGPGVTQIHELGPVIVTRTDSSAASDTISVVLRDRLGSTINVVDSTAASTTRSYDAFGKPLEGWGAVRFTLGLNQTIHGFTKHEHDDDVLLINMVGRLYDYQLGRFLQVDPVIQSPANSQSLNPYSYILNNPLAGKDPTGYRWEDGDAGYALALTVMHSTGMLSDNDMRVLHNSEVAAGPFGSPEVVAVTEAAPAIREAVTEGHLSGATATQILKTSVSGILNAVAGKSAKANGSEKQAVADRRSKDASSTGQSSEADKNLQANKAKGNAFEGKVGQAIRNKGDNEVEDQVRVRTKEGEIRVYDHIEADQKTGAITYHEDKSGDAKRSNDQIRKDTSVQQNGATVDTSRKDSLQKGQVLPPGKVQENRECHLDGNGNFKC